MYLVVLNFSTESVVWGLPPSQQEHAARDWTVVVSTSGRTARSDRGLLARMTLEPYEGIVFRRQIDQTAGCGCDQLADTA